MTPSSTTLHSRIHVEGAEVLVTLVRDHRMAIRLRGPGLGIDVSDTDPLVTGVPPLERRALDAHSERAAHIAAVITRQAREILAGEPHANGLLLRGFGTLPRLTPMREGYGLAPGAVAAYPPTVDSRGWSACL